MIKFLPADTIDIAREMLNYAENVANGDKSSIPAQCPQCGNQKMHIFWNVFAGRKAGLWVWCSHCGASEHATAKAPLWWRNIENPDITGNLMDTNFEEHRDEIDRHLQALMESHFKGI